MDNSTNEAWIDKLIDELVDAKNEICDLTADSAKLNILTKLIINGSRLNYDGNGLRIDNESAVFDYLRVIAPVSFETRLDNLKEERDAELARARHAAEIKKAKAEVAATKEEA